MKRILLIFLITLTVMFSACSDKKAEEIYETAQFEELQKNTVHAKQLYEEIIEKYPDTEYAVKASERLNALEGKK
jgi:TolA-binding protein